MDHIWVMVDQDGEQTLFQLTAMGGAADAIRLVKERRLPVVMVDVALPPETRIEEVQALSGTTRARLVVVKLHTASEGHAPGVVAYRDFERDPIAESSPVPS